MSLTGRKEERDIVPVRCRSCRRTIALSTGTRLPLYCDELCVADIPAVENEDRNALMEVLFQCANISQRQMSNDFPVTRQAINLILQERASWKAEFKAAV